MKTRSFLYSILLVCLLLIPAKESSAQGPSQGWLKASDAHFYFPDPGRSGGAAASGRFEWSGGKDSNGYAHGLGTLTWDSPRNRNFPKTVTQYYGEAIQGRFDGEVFSRNLVLPDLPVQSRVFTRGASQSSPRNAKSDFDHSKFAKTSLYQNPTIKTGDLSKWAREKNPKDAKESFFIIVKRIDADIGRQYSGKGSYSYKFDKKSEFDIKKTDSIIAPLLGEISVPIRRFHDGRYHSTGNLDITLDYIDGKWAVKECDCNQRGDNTFWLPHIEKYTIFSDD